MLNIILTVGQSSNEIHVVAKLWRPQRILTLQIYLIRFTDAPVGRTYLTESTGYGAYLYNKRIYVFYLVQYI